MRNFQGNVFMWSRAYIEIFKSTLIYLYGLALNSKFLECRCETNGNRQNVA